MPGALGSGSWMGPNGIINFGPSGKLHISKLNGVDDLPSLDIADIQRPFLDGAFRGHRRLDSRVVIAGFTLIGTDTNDYDNQVQAFLNAFVHSDSDGSLFLFNSSRLVKGYVSRRSIPYECGPRGFSGEAAVEFICDDPRVYDGVATGFVVSLPQTSGGMGFNFGFSFGFGAAGTGGVASVNNVGNYPAPAVIHISGPVSNPIIGNDTLGLQLKFLLSLGATDFLDVDLDQRLVTLNGTGNRNNTVDTPSRWWLFPPGVSQFRFNADAFTAAQASFQFRSAWA